MGGDLNLKKSWHPVLMSNQKRVWEEEQKALEERKKIDQIRRERDEEREIQELQDLQEAAGGKKRQSRVDWMYNGPSSGQVGTTEDMEGYLLGKRRIDGLLKGKDNDKLEKAATEASFMAMQSANTARDTASKIREDPMLAIKKQEQAAYEAMMSDPVKRKLLLRAAGQEDSQSSERDHKRRKHHHRHREDDDGHRRRMGRDDQAEDENEDARRERPRRRGSLSRDSETGLRPTRSSRHHRRDYRNSSRSRSRSPRHSRRSTTSYRDRRSNSPADRGARSDSRSPYRNGHREQRGEVRKMKSWHSSRQARSKSPEVAEPPKSSSEDRAARLAERLAAMQQDAASLDQQRIQRLAEIEARDRAVTEKDNESRARNAKYGGRASFVNEYHKKAGDLTLSDRMGRSGVSGRTREED